MLVACPLCNEEREVLRDRNQPCRKCSNGSGVRKEKTDKLYTHTCGICSITWTTKSAGRPKTCRPCAVKIIAEKNSKEVWMHDYNCKVCGKLVKAANKRKTHTCIECRSENNRKKKKQATERKKYDRSKWPSYINKNIEKKIEAEKRRNQKHKEMLLSEEKPKPREMSWEQQQELIKQFYEKNEVKHYDVVEEYGTTSSCRASIDAI